MFHGLARGRGTGAGSSMGSSGEWPRSSGALSVSSSSTNSSTAEDFLRRARAFRAFVAAFWDAFLVSLHP